LPIEQPTRFELIVNTKTAKAQNIEIPTLILAQADQIIESEPASMSAFWPLADISLAAAQESRHQR
jgi:hypothetical protein